MSDGTSALVVVGIVLLIAGGVGAVYGQMTLMQEQADGEADDGALIDFGGDEDGEGGETEETVRYRTIRLGGLAAGAVGTVVAFTGAAMD